MSTRLNVRQLFVLSLLAFGLLAAGSACYNDPNSEGCSYNQSNHTCG